MTNVLTADPNNQKLRGGYYTPLSIAQFLARWAIRTADDTVLEPSCGDGMLLEEAVRRLTVLGTPLESMSRQVQGVELYDSEARLACARMQRLGIPGCCVATQDFFSFNDSEWGLVSRRFDAVVGNPPFLRYHAFPEEQRARAFRIMQTVGLRPSKLTNSWVAFLVAAALCLTERGRPAMVIPAELLQVKYAEQTRAFLARHFGAITIITFRRLVFDGIQQEVVLLLAEKQPAVESGIDVVELEDALDLADYEVRLRARRHLKSIDHAEEKWTQYYLDENEIDLLRAAKSHPRVTRFGELGCVDVGVVTGRNNFFVLPEQQVRAKGLIGHTLPLVGRTAQLPGLVYTDEDWQANREAGVLCHLLNLPPTSFDLLPASLQEYVQAGELADVHQGFKCSHRKPWYAVPTVWSPDAFLFRQIHEYPKLVQNMGCATSTDTIHRVRFHQPHQTPQIVGAFLNSLTFSFAEVMGRSYGGGVLELEPNEAEQIPIPFFEQAPLPFDELDTLERARRVDTLLDINDAELLGNQMGFDASDVKLFRTIWRKLSGRRMGRKAKSSRK